MLLSQEATNTTANKRYKTTMQTFLFAVIALIVLMCILIKKLIHSKPPIGTRAATSASNSHTLRQMNDINKKMDAHAVRRMAALRKWKRSRRRASREYYRQIRYSSSLRTRPAATVKATKDLMDTSMRSSVVLVKNAGTGASTLFGAWKRAYRRQTRRPSLPRRYIHRFGPLDPPQHMGQKAL